MNLAGLAAAVCGMMILSAALLFLAGRHAKIGAWWLSLTLLASMSGAAWMVVVRFAGLSLSLPLLLAFTLLPGLVVIFANRNLNWVGHLALSTTVSAVFAYLAYSASVLAGPLALTGRIAAVLLLALQSATLLLLLGTIFETIDVVCRTRWNGPGGARTETGHRPIVSIHVPIHAEPPELVIETLNALARLDYSDFEVLVIDNNTVDDSLWLPVRAHCDALGARFRFFHLMDWPGYKSGALNFAAAETAAEAELIAVVDADYVVEPHFLKDLVGHFEDPQVAFVQTPQDYRDGESRGRYGRALYRAYMYFFQVSMRSRNETNAIIYAGTMGLIRRSALIEVGGWSEWCITEDAELSLRLLAAGYSSVFISETYGRGLMPLDLSGLKKQRFRWAFGGMQLLRLHWRSLMAPHSPLTLGQRFGFINGGLQWLNDLFAIFYTAILLVGTGMIVASGRFGTPTLVESLLLISPLFLMLSIIRFLWAFRVQNRCSWREAGDAMSVLIALCWVVGVACVRGLFSRNGVFLRTPKQAGHPRLSDALRIVEVEALLASACLGGALALLLTPTRDHVIARYITLALLLWQSATFLAAVRLALWSHAQALGLDSGIDLVSAMRKRLVRWAGPDRVRLVVTSIAVVLGMIGYLASPTAESDAGAEQRKHQTNHFRSAERALGHGEPEQSSIREVPQ